MVGDLLMADNASLSTEHNIFSCFDGACDPRLRHDNIVGANIDIVTDLNEIVDFGSTADSGHFEPRAVDGCIRTDRHIIFDDDNAKLVEFGMFAFGILVLVLLFRPQGILGKRSAS